MNNKFDYFVILAEMRTGSNFLESNINAFSDLHSFGEAFNPVFIGYPNKTDLLGIDQETRDADPNTVIEAVIAYDKGLGGFRYFHDHDPRVLDRMLDDPKCAKVILTRNPAESYVSWKIAAATGQWKLTNAAKRKKAQAVFDASEFSTFLQDLQSFQIAILNRLQKSGQTGFYIAYEDLQDVEILNGLASFLGSSEKVQELNKNLKPQNPEPLSAKVENYDEMERALADLDGFNLTRTPNFEPRRSPSVPSFIATAEEGLLFMPISGGPQASVTQWMSQIDSEELITGFSQKTLRQWKRRHKSHRSFTVLSHPLERAYATFCTKILSTDDNSFPHIRQNLETNFGLKLGSPDQPLNKDQTRTAFAGFLEFVTTNLNGQTTIRVDAHWATQTAILQGFGEFCSPDMVLRAEDLQVMLPAIATQAKSKSIPDYVSSDPTTDITLSDIYDDALESLAQDAYQRDYVMFGFKKWNRR